MGRLVRLYKGQWSKSQQGVWSFNQDHTVTVQDILVKVNESIETLLNLGNTNVDHLQAASMDGWPIRSHNPPPLNIVSNTDVEIMMAEEVARYQFVCRTTFTIGDRTFLTDGVSEEQHLATINEIIGDDEINCPRRFLEELFNQDKMVVIFCVVDGNGDHIVPDIGNVNEVGPEWGEGDQYGSVDGFGDMNDSAYQNVPGGHLPPNWSGIDIGPARSTWDISLVISLLGDLRLSQGHKLYQFFLGLRVYHHLLLQISHRWFDGNVSGATVGHGGGASTTVLQDNNAKRGEKGNTDGPGGDH
uniref:Uncharacterized protein n=1 Tax=Brassica oleracea TaxID=3712 RepID=Q25BK5_BRAOL|nr:hypothetical protein 23.t00035 [Brassica oleracea]